MIEEHNVVVLVAHSETSSGTRSSSAMRYLRLTGAAIACLLGAYFTFLSIRASRSGLSWREMDFNHDGSTSVREFLEGADVGTRSTSRNGRACTEYFLLKDGMPVKLVCPAH
jgi:hypothetical protein